MFEQHPVPQQISSYQFRLVGDMTIKQFFQIASGAVIALIIYALPLPNFLRWPLVATSVILGAAFAFLPIQERPMAEWIAAFFRSIYSPTIFFWNPEATKQQYFALEGGQATASAQSAPQNVQAEDKSVAALEHAESSALSKLTGLFLHKASPPTPVTVAQQPLPQAQSAPIPTQTQPLQGTIQVAVPTTATPIVENKGYIPLATTASTTQVQAQTTAVDQTLPSSTEAKADIQAAQFSPDAAPPMIPESPNLIAGQVMTQDKHIVEGAILEIKDSEGRSVRALKTNKAGHFFIVTPLSDGEYKIEIEKENLQFEPVSITMKGEIIPPIAIEAN